MQPCSIELDERLEQTIELEMVCLSKSLTYTSGARFPYSIPFQRGQNHGLIQALLKHSQLTIPRPFGVS